MHACTTWQIGSRGMVPAELAAATPPAIAVDSRLLMGINGLLIVAVSSAPLLSAELAATPSAWLSKVVPLLGRFLAAILRRVASACENARLRREQLFVLAHGAITYALGDAIAQAAMRPSDSAGGMALWVPSLTAWAAAVGLLSDTLPFYHWSSFLSSFDHIGGPRRAALERRLPIVARKPALILPLKVAVHLATIQPASTAAYLYLQGLLKGAGPIGSLAFVRERFLTAVLPALLTFLVGGPLIYSLPVVAGAALRNLGVLGMCVYLAFVASR